MVVLTSIIESIPWDDYFHIPVSPVIPKEDEGGWEIVGQPKMNQPEIQPPVKWCRNGNKCLWRNCKFRHERCVHYDNWVRRGKKGNPCRAHEADPDSTKSPSEGGCKYDHRDPTKLQMFLETLPCATERQLWDNFYERGLDLHISDVFNVRNMSSNDRSLLVRSLKAADIEFVDNGHYMYIYYLDD